MLTLLKVLLKIDDKGTQMFDRVKCVPCDTSFTTDSEIKQHHCIPKVYSCDECNVVFKLKRQLTRHIVKKHSMLRECNWCHIMIQTSPKQMYYCDDCKEKCFRECRRCHRPFREEKYFELDAKRCNACQRKYLREIETGQWHSWYARFYNSYEDLPHDLPQE